MRFLRPLDVAKQVHDRDKRVVAGELVLRPAALLGAALSCLRNTGLYMAARLGTTCKDVMNDHSMWNMALVYTPALAPYLPIYLPRYLPIYLPIYTSCKDNHA